MRPIGIALAVAFAMAGLWPSALRAANGGQPAPVTAEDRAKGMAAAPRLISAALADCRLADARELNQRFPASSRTRTAAYELACAGGEGLVIAGRAPAGAPEGSQLSNLVVYTCLEANNPQSDGKPNPLACILAVQRRLPPWICFGRS